MAKRAAGDDEGNLGLECQGKSEPGTLWMGTAPGGLFRSEDGGKSWNLVRGLWDRPQRSKWFGGGTEFPALHSICVDPRDPRTVRVAVSCGGVAKTTDDGQTWASTADGMFAEYMPPDLQKDPDVQDPHQMVQCPDQPDHLWVQHHNGVFRTTDGGDKWEVVPDIKPSVFGFGVAVHPRDGNTAWFVPAIKDERRIPVDGKLVVTRTRDGGKSFDVLTDGLPQEKAYDLVYRHAWRSTTAATDWPSARRQAGYGSRKTRGIAGRKYHHTCRDPRGPVCMISVGQHAHFDKTLISTLRKSTGWLSD